ncbi:MAG: ACP S-malonyltransferase [Arenibacterium sp.]
MSRTAVLICPGRGTYNAEELGYLARHHADKQALFKRFDAIRAESGQEPVTTLDGAAKFSRATHTRGDVASPLIYASSLADAQSLADDIEVVAVTGNSMGWYIALAAAGAVSVENGFRVVNTMGTLMQTHLIGGQLVYPVTEEDWRPDPARRAALLDQVAEIGARDGHALALSIDLGGMLVIAGNAAGLDAFDAAVPQIGGRFPLRLPNHAAFHTALQEPVAAQGRETLPVDMFTQPKHPMIDGRGHVWWPGSSALNPLWAYTLGAQVVEPYDFARAIQTAAEAFAPDLFIVTGPGTTLGGAVAQSLIKARWKGMQNKADFQARQTEKPILVSMGNPEQRAWVV